MYFVKLQNYFKEKITVHVMLFKLHKTLSNNFLATVFVYFYIPIYSVARVLLIKISRGGVNKYLSLF